MCWLHTAATHSFFDHPWVPHPASQAPRPASLTTFSDVNTTWYVTAVREARQKGGELAFCLASLTAVTYPVESTFENVAGRRDDALAKVGEALAKV